MSLPQTLEALRAANATQAERIETQAERILQLEAALQSGEPLWSIPGLTGMDVILLRVMLKFEFASFDQILLALYGSAIDVEGRDKYNIRPLITYLRRKLLPHGIPVESVWGRGYRLAAQHKIRLRALMAGPVLAEEGTPC